MIRCFDNGDLFTVQANDDHAHAFGQNWPCFELHWGDTTTATFEKSNGDLVDLTIRHAYRGDVTEERDGEGVRVYLDDLRDYGKERLHLEF